MKRIFLVVSLIIATNVYATAQRDFILKGCYIDLEDKFIEANGKIHWTDSKIIIEDEVGLIQIVLDDSTFKKDTSENDLILFKWLAELTFQDTGKSSNMAIIVSYEDTDMFLSIQSLTSDFSLTYYSAETVRTKFESFRDKGYIIKEAYLIEESGTSDLMETILDHTSPTIIYLPSSDNDSLKIIVSNDRDEIIVFCKGVEMEDKVEYIDYVKYYDDDNYLVVPDIKQMAFYEMDAVFSLFKENEFSDTLVSREKLKNTIEKYGEQLYLFTFYIKDIHLQIYAVEVDLASADG